MLKTHLNGQHQEYCSRLSIRVFQLNVVLIAQMDEEKEAKKLHRARLILAGHTFADDDDPFEGLTPQVCTFQRFPFALLSLLCFGGNCPRMDPGRCLMVCRRLSSTCKRQSQLVHRLQTHLR